jgi:ribosome maturation factor RimP
MDVVQVNVHSKVSSSSSLFFMENLHMATNDTVARITELSGPLLTSLGLELVDCEYKKEGRAMVLRLFIDREGGISLDDCASVSRELSELLDVEDVVPAEYTLEVSSPGLCRPLKKEADYLRYVGRLTKIKTFELCADDEGNPRKTFLGELLGIEDGIVRIKLQEGQTAGIPLDKIAKAHLEFEF